MDEMKFMLSFSRMLALHGSLKSLHQLNLSNNQLSGELQLPEEFIDRLGKRADVKGNPGLCTGDYMKKNIYMLYHQIPPCLEKQIIIGDHDNKNNKTFQNHPDDTNAQCMAASD
ncbi:hypothetical protein Q3G72_009108 [Acer saccharum]|nr:hypothetical protein Q3G72_009108 [Acer saccharum]